MIGFFIKGDEAKITRTGNTSVSLEMYDGRKFENRSACFLYPV